jgi:hypothetical protein
MAKQNQTHKLTYKPNLVRITDAQQKGAWSCVCSTLLIMCKLTTKHVPLMTHESKSIWSQVKSYSTNFQYNSTNI